MDTVEKIVILLSPHLPFIGFLIVNSAIEHTLEANIFTRKATFLSKPRWFWIWGRKLLPLYPIFNGAILALLWERPEPGVVSLTQRVIYFGSAGALSIFAYDVVCGLARKQGVDLRQHREPSTIPPEGGPAVPGSEPPPAGNDTTGPA